MWIRHPATLRTGREPGQRRRASTHTISEGSHDPGRRGSGFWSGSSGCLCTSAARFSVGQRAPGRIRSQTPRKTPPLRRGLPPVFLSFGCCPTTTRPRHSRVQAIPHRQGSLWRTENVHPVQCGSQAIAQTHQGPLTLGVLRALELLPRVVNLGSRLFQQ